MMDNVNFQEATRGEKSFPASSEPEFEPEELDAKLGRGTWPAFHLQQLQLRTKDITSTWRRIKVGKGIEKKSKLDKIHAAQEVWVPSPKKEYLYFYIFLQSQ